MNNETAIHGQIVIALEALKGTLTMDQIAASRGVSPSQVENWKNEVLSVLKEKFDYHDPMVSRHDMSQEPRSVPLDRVPATTCSNDSLSPT
jgi:hypothetical protein